MHARIPVLIVQPRVAQTKRLPVEFKHPLIPLQGVIGQVPGPDPQLGHFRRHQQLLTGRHSLFFSGFAGARVHTNTQITTECPELIAHGGYRQHDRKARTIFTHVGPLAGFRALQFSLMHERAEPLDLLAILRTQLATTGGHFLTEMEAGRRALPDQFICAITQHALCAGIEYLDSALQISGNNCHLGGGAQHATQQQIELP